MMSELTRLHDEAKRILTVYSEHKHSEDKDMRRRAHLQADRFLMEHREVALLMMVDGLSTELNRLIAEARPEPKVSLIARLWSTLRNRKETSTS